MRRPAFLDPLVGVLLGDDVDELPLADLVGDEVATRPDPLGVACRLEHVLRHVAALQQRAPHHLTRISRVVAAIERLTDDRPHAIGADHVLGFYPTAARKNKNDAITMLFYSGEAVSEMNGAVI